jgi:homoserine dehydrogenase
MIAAHTIRSLEVPLRGAARAPVPQTNSVQANTVRIGLIGCGGVGEEVVRQLARRAETYRGEFAADLRITGILVRDPDRPHDDTVDRSLLTTQFEDLLNSAPDLIIEVAGGTHPASQWIAESLRRGIPVVTANKSVIARHGSALRRLAAEHDTELAYEAAVGAAVPVIAALRQRAGDSLRSLHAVLNGSTAFVLGFMAEHGCELPQALREAQRLGLAESDPSRDLSGVDSAEKLCILAAEAGLPGLHPDALDCCRGIEDITRRDLEAAAAQRCVLRLTARLDVCGGQVRRAVVRPSLLPLSHPLARLRGAENGVRMDHADAGPLLLTGSGAGPAPTASAILGDVIRLCRRSQRAADGSGVSPDIAPGEQPVQTEAIPPGPLERSFLRVRSHERDSTALPEPQRVLSALEQAGIAVHHIEFRARSVEAIVDTAQIPESALREVLGLSHETSILCAPVEPHP